jgi:hypothetical protein
MPLFEKDPTMKLLTPTHYDKSYTIKNEPRK